MIANGQWPMPNGQTSGEYIYPLSTRFPLALGCFFASQKSFGRSDPWHTRVPVSSFLSAPVFWQFCRMPRGAKRPAINCWQRKARVLSVSLSVALALALAWLRKLFPKTMEEKAHARKGLGFGFGGFAKRAKPKISHRHFFRMFLCFARTLRRQILRAK